MPTYTYRCKACGHEFDELQRISDETLVTCPKCNQPALVRVIGGGAGLHFKGSGFYLTDYKKKSSSDTSGTKSEPKKETKPPDSKPADATPPASDPPPPKP
jgi:putative FmdB family regulatory protein